MKSSRSVELCLTALICATVAGLAWPMAGVAQTAKAAEGVANPATHVFHPPKQWRAAAQASGAPAAADVEKRIRQQIAALEKEKSQRTPAQNKVSPQLLFTARMLQGKPVANGIAYLETGTEIDDQNRLLVDMGAEVTDSLLARLRAAGATVVNTVPAYHAVRALIPHDRLEEIAGWPDVQRINPRRIAMTNGKLSPKSRLLDQGFDARAARLRSYLSSALPMAAAVVPGSAQGTQVSEGDVAHKADVARSTYGTSGSGVKIGVLSDGVLSLAQSQELGDLGPVTVLPGQDGAADCLVGETCDEGTAMLEIIHDLAPNAQLYFATAFGGAEQFAQNIRDLRDAGCDIIVDDVSYFTESPFQDGQPGLPADSAGGLVIQAVNDVVASGAMYFSSAANSGNQDSQTSGTWEGMFADGGPVEGSSTERLHQFAPGKTYDTELIDSGGAILLFWSDPLLAAANDYDLYVFDVDGTPLMASNTEQDGSGDPYEAVSGDFNYAGVRIVIVKFSGQDEFLHLATSRGVLEFSTSGATYGHNAGRRTQSVAATPAYLSWDPNDSASPTGPFPGVFGADDLVELFSSDGPRRIFYEADGTPINGSDGTVLQKPDFTAADGVSVTGLGFGSAFYGTSAAAPHAAAIAGLLKSANPAASSTAIVAALDNSAIDIMGSDWDQDSGAGILMADAAIGRLGAARTGNPNLGNVTVAETLGNADGYVSTGESGTLTLELNNLNGAAPATAISATLTTSTAGVVIAEPSTLPYPDLAVGETAANETPFLFTLTNAFPVCGQPVDFTLTVTYAGAVQPRVLPFSIRAGLPPVAIPGTLGTPSPATGGVTIASGVQTGRLARIWSEDYSPSTCYAPKTFPGTASGDTAGRAFDSYTFTACRNACAIAEVTPPPETAPGLWTSIYSPTYFPGNISANYVGDSGYGYAPQAMSFSVTAGTTYTLVTHEVVPDTMTGQSYTMLISGCALNCSAPNQVPIARAHDVTVTAGGDGYAPASIDNGSNDPDGGAITTTQAPAGPYPVGRTRVILTVTDNVGAVAQANAYVTVLNAGGADLMVASSHSQNFRQEQTDAAYSITVSNFGTAASSGTVTVVDTLPAALTATAIAGNGWDCSLQNLTCTRSDALPSAGSYPPITLTVTVAEIAPWQVNNTVTVSGGGDTVASNNSSVDATTIVSEFGITAASNTATVVAGTSASYSLLVSVPQGAGTVRFTCTGLPTGAEYTLSPSTATQSAMVTLTITTRARGTSSANRPETFGGTAPFYAFLALPAIGLLGFSTRSGKRRLGRIAGLGVVLIVIMAWAACGGGGSSTSTPPPVHSFGTPAGTYTVKVTATAGSTNVSTNVTLTVQ